MCQRESLVMYEAASNMWCGMWEIVPENLRKAMERARVNNSELARLVGIKQPSVTRLLSGETKTPRSLFALAKALNVTPEFLKGEVDHPFSISEEWYSNRDAMLRGDPLPFPDVELPVLKDLRHEYRGGMPVPTNPKELAEQLGSVLIPQLEIGYSMGGGSVFSDFQQTAMVPFPRDWLRALIKGQFEDLFVTRGEGDSMIPTLLDRDLVVVDTAQKNITQQDRIWCLSYGDLGMIKRVRVLPDGGVQVNSDNPAVTPITAYDGELHIIGRVIWIGRRV